METYLCETLHMVYYRDEQYDSVVMYRKADGFRWRTPHIAESSMMEDIIEGGVTKISPDFIYDYKEILKEHKKTKI